MPSFRLKRIALEDLKGIVRYIAADNPAAARKFRDDLYEKLQFLALNPRIAPERPDLVPNLRYLPYGDYLIFYLLEDNWPQDDGPEDDGIVIIRVLHGARLISPELIASAI